MDPGKSIPRDFSETLLRWFDKAGRKDLPWRENRTSYRVWVAEVMLQQTQVKTARKYFPIFISRFPKLEALAAASLDEVLGCWAGLGYYARARNLHKTARIVRTELPATYKELLALPGIGRSTAGAILALSRGSPYPVLDANVKRLLSRYFQRNGHAATRTELWQLSQELLPTDRIADYTQSLMDFGATVCKPRPQCPACPFADDCGARQRMTVAEPIPPVKHRKKRPLLHKHLIVAQQPNQVLLQKRPPRGIWGGLYSLPEFSSIEALQKWCRRHLQKEAIAAKAFTHTLTHLQFRIHPFVLKLPKMTVVPETGDNMRWHRLQSIAAVPAPIKRILKEHCCRKENDNSNQQRCNEYRQHEQGREAYVGT